MKIKWLVILFILYLVIMLVSVFLSKPSEENIIEGPVIKKAVPEQSADVMTEAQISAFPNKNNITIISRPVAHPKENLSITAVLPDKEVDSTQASPEENEFRSGITKDENKYPTVEKMAEMNSAGIVMY